MARIRTIKPEFWTDEVLVQLPFEARLLFIGLWNFADDYGALPDSAERIRLQVLPGDADVDVGQQLDLLAVAGLLDRFKNQDGSSYLQIRNWHKHQRVDKPSAIRAAREGSRKVAIPFSERRALAEKYGCATGETADASCYYCGAPGAVHWHRRRDGRPSAWVTFSCLEIDHFVAESEGGATVMENFVLACRTCNRAKQTAAALVFVGRNSARAREGSRGLHAGSGSEGYKGSGSDAREAATPKSVDNSGVVPDGLKTDAETRRRQLRAALADPAIIPRLTA